ncbi:MAG: glycosyltransferase family A protein [Flavobacteriales bacterium]|jgi:glycosyltransferase involved in cell wall biosynthesis|nr:glycosyltransferase family A protein [Flavobacteriales bacterium]
MNHLKSIIRKVLSVLLYHGWYKWVTSWNKARNGRLLKNGICAVVSAKNEAYIIPFCLKSLLGIVDQIVCIDNGSDDGTLQVMQDFKTRFGDRIEVDVLEMPGALLGDCRNAGLEHTRYKWHLRWDADMVCRNSGPDDMKLLRQEVLNNDRPRTIQLPRTNLRGDFHHTRKNLPAIDPGEPILVRFGKDIKYVEYGKFDVIKVPFYYAIEKQKKRYYFHCEGLKSDDNLIYRRQYFEWREAFNMHTDASRPSEIFNFELFKKNWCEKEFETTDTKELKWRFQREFCNRLEKIDEQLFGEYPDVLKAEMKNENTRFEVVLKNGKPYCRIDRFDKEMLHYKPTESDLKWAKDAGL